MTEDIINDFYTKIFPIYSNDIYFFQNESSSYEENSVVLKESTKCDKTQRNNNMNVQTQNTSKKSENAIEGKKENSSLTKKDSKNIKSIKFITHKTRRVKNPNEIKHKFDDEDNLTVRTKINFNNFLISLANDASNTIFKNHIPKDYFKKLDYNDNRKLSQIEEKKYRNIFELKISKKNKGIIGELYDKENYNNEIYKNIAKNSPLLEDFFDKSYLDLFENYYYKNIREFDFEDVHFKLSKNTKTYKDLLEKGKNSSVEYKFENVINKKYLNKNSK